MVTLGGSRSPLLLIHLRSVPYHTLIRLVGASSKSGATPFVSWWTREERYPISGKCASSPIRIKYAHLDNQLSEARF